MRKLLLPLLPLLAAAAAQAAPPAVSMDVAPTTLELTPGRPGLFYVSNHGPQPVTVRIEGFDWEQPGGADRLAPSGDLVVSPPLATIAPEARQLVRVLAPAAKGERSFRLLVSQLPVRDATPIEPPPNVAAGTAVRILLRFGVPVFAGDPVTSSPVLAWNVARHGHAILLTARNDGPHTAKLVGVRLADGGTTAKPDDDSFAWLLPGAIHTFTFSHPPQGASLHLAARDGRGGSEVIADISAPP
ncbi:MAG: fimbria/pilus periplasmic chaperone [Rhizomicrobium sp.]